jgi:hypothetical protein
MVGWLASRARAQAATAAWFWVRLELRGWSAGFQADGPEHKQPCAAGGKYPVAFRLDLPRAIAQELLSVSPEEGSIEPGKEVTVQVGG